MFVGWWHQRRGLGVRAMAALALAVFFCSSVHAADPAAAPRWWKGCLHAHSLWSDGDVFPENAVAWYKRHGYHFMMLTDHNNFQQGRRWLVQQDPRTAQPGGKRKVASPAAMKAYRTLFGPQWVDECTSGGKPMVRLKTLEEFRGKLEVPGRFLLIPGEEISGRVHLNAFNITGTIELPMLPDGQADSKVWLARAMAARVAEQGRAAGRPMLVQLNHPGWANSPLTIDEVARIDCLNVMEINNDNSGSSASLPATAMMWDAVLTRRMEQGRPMMWGTAGDDTHEYILPNNAPDGGPDHGWVMVRTADLTPESVLRALATGDFYATSGVMLRDLRCDGRRLALQITPQRGARFTTEFIGTRKGGPSGEVLATVKGLRPVYQFKGDELYVRAKVTSSRLRTVCEHQPACEMAWIQPRRPGQAGAK